MPDTPQQLAEAALEAWWEARHAATTNDRHRLDRALDALRDRIRDVRAGLPECGRAAA